MTSLSVSYVILGDEEVITNDLVAREPDFFNSEISLDGPISLKKLTRQCVRELERKVILKVLQQHHWNRKQAARTLGISYRALLYKIRDAGLAQAQGAVRGQAGAHHPRARVTNEQIVAIRASALSYSRLAELHCVSKSTIAAIKTFRTWRIDEVAQQS